MKPRHHLYLDHDLTNQLDVLAAKPGTSKSAIVADALRQYLNPKTDSDNTHAIKMRLDRLTRQVSHVERNLHVALESISARQDVGSNDGHIVCQRPRVGFSARQKHWMRHLSMRLPPSARPGQCRRRIPTRTSSACQSPPAAVESNQIWS